MAYRSIVRWQYIFLWNTMPTANKSTFYWMNEKNTFFQSNHFSLLQWIGRKKNWIFILLIELFEFAKRYFSSISQLIRRNSLNSRLSIFVCKCSVKKYVTNVKEHCLCVCVCVRAPVNVYCIVMFGAFAFRFRLNFFLPAGKHWLQYRNTIPSINQPALPIFWDKSFTDSAVLCDGNCRHSISQSVTRCIKLLNYIEILVFFSIAMVYNLVCPPSFSGCNMESIII